MLLQKPSSEEIIELSGDHKSGAEHHVWFDRARGLVRKTPTNFGKLWQKMHADYAERDLNIMQESGIPLVPTEIHREAEVCLAGQTRTRVEYVLEQPLYADSHEMTYGDLLHNKKHLQKLLELARIGQDIRAKKDLGLDILGGKAIKLVPSALNPRVKAMPAQIGNLLVADSTITATRDWPKFGIKKGGIIANDGDVRHCDPRLYDFNGRGGLRGKILHCLLLKFQDVQDTVLWSILASFDIKSEFDLEMTRLRRLVRRLVEHATPKMRAYAEAMG